MNGIKSKDGSQRGGKRQDWSPVKHPLGVPFPYEDGPAIHVPAHLHHPPLVHSYGPGVIHLMAHPGGRNVPVQFMPSQEVSSVNGIEGQGNTGAFMGAAGAVHLNSLPFPQIQSFPPKVHRVPRPLPEVDPSLIGSLTGPPILESPTFVPPIEGPHSISHPALSPSVVTPSAFDPPFVEPNALEVPAFHGDTPSSQVVQQVPVPVPVESPPKRIPFPVPYPVHLPPQVKHLHNSVHLPP